MHGMNIVEASKSIQDLFEIYESQFLWDSALFL